MLFLIICTIIGIAVGIKFGEGSEEYLLLILLGLCIGALLFFIVGLPLGAIIPREEIVTTQEIVALTDSAATEGKKYIFSGYTEEKLVYRYVINTEKGKQIQELKDINVYIKEGDYEPKVVIHEFKQKMKKLSGWLFIPLSSNKNYAEFYVPVNTITTEYNVDLQ